MAFTKVLGPGIHTQANILSHNINSSGIITATKFVGPFDGITIGSGTTIGADGINVTGIVTCTTLDVNGNADILGNLVVHGDTTTLNTTLREVELLHVDANSSVSAGIITQTGAGDILNLFDGTTEVFTVLDTGEVGIGTVTPGRDLHILNTTPYIRVESDAANQPATLELYHTRGNGSDHWPTSVATDDAALTFNVATAANGSPAEKVRITSAGLVGIGEDTPTRNLHIDGTAHQSGIIIHTAGNHSTAIDMDSNRSSAAGGLAELNFKWNGTTVGQIGAYAGADTTNKDDGHIHFGTASAGSIVERFRITSDGKVGINEDVPQSTLHVASTSNYVDIGLSNSTSGHTGSDGANIFLNNSLELALWNRESTGIIRFATEGTEKLRITAAGNLALGNDGSFPIFTDANDRSLIIGTGSDDAGIQLHSASDRFGGLYFGDATSGGDRYRGYIEFKHGTSDDYMRFGTGGTERLKLDKDGHLTPAAADSQDLGSTSKEFRNVYIGNSGRVYLGSAQEVSLYHDGNNTYLNGGSGTGLMQIKNTGGGDVELFSNNSVKLRVNGGENAVVCNFNNSVDLYYDANVYTTPKLKTSHYGITVDGEVAASQDYPNYRPTLDLNFAAVKKLDPRIAYSRTGPASYVDEFGIVQLVGVNTPRFDHDPTTRECKGLLVETPRTNQWLQSVTLADYVTGGNLQGGATLADAGTSTKDPAGGYNATKMASGNSGGAHSIYKNFTSGSNGDVHTFSVWVKAAGADHARIYVDTVGGNLNGPGVTFSTKNTWNINASGVGTQVATSAVEYPNGWWRLSVTGSYSNRNDFYCHIDIEGGEGDISYSGNGSNGIYVWGAQFEVGQNPNSYIPTYGATVTRGADFVKIDGTEFTDFYNQSEGTLLSEFTWNGNVITSGSIANINALSTSSYADSIMFMEMGTANGYFGRVYKSSNGTQLSNGSSVTANIFGGAGPDKVSYAWSDTVVNEGLAAYWNGSEVNTSSTETNTPTNMTELRIGQGWQSPTNDTSGLNAHIKRLSYYPKRLPDTQLKTLTS